MKISQKQTCHSCRALVRANCAYAQACDLGYDIKTHFVPDSDYCIPLEPCPKPINRDDLHVAKLTLKKVIRDE
jgi:hypothetical protein